MQDFNGSVFGDDEMAKLNKLREEREKESIRAAAKVQARGELVEAYQQVEDSIVALEAERRQLSALYAKCETMDSTIETELGNSLVLLRKSIAQLRKSAKELLQPHLPMGEDDDDGGHRQQRRHLH